MNGILEWTHGKAARAFLLGGLVGGLAACGGGGDSDSSETGDGSTVSNPGPSGDYGIATILEGDWTYCDTGSLVSGRVNWFFRGNTYKEEVYTYGNGSCEDDGTEVKLASMGGRFTLGEGVMTEEGLQAQAIDLYLREIDGEEGPEQTPRFNIIYFQDGSGLYFGDLTVVDDAFEERTNKLELEEPYLPVGGGQTP